MSIDSSDNLQSYIDLHAIPATIIHLQDETPTVAAAAAALGVPVEQVVKTVIFIIDGTPHAIFANGVQRVDWKKLAAHFQVSRKKIRLADAESVIALTGYAPGT